VARIGHMNGLSSSSFQSGNEMPLENGSTSHVRASPWRSSRCFRQLFSFLALGATREQVLLHVLARSLRRRFHAVLIATLVWYVNG
jgi:hypothetical protein